MSKCAVLKEELPLAHLLPFFSPHLDVRPPPCGPPAQVPGVTCLPRSPAEQAPAAPENRLRLRVVGGAAAVPPRPHTELPPPPPTLMPDRREPLACLAIAHCPPCEPQCWPLPRTPDSYTEGPHPQLLNPQLTALGCSLLTPTILAESENWLWWEDPSPNCHTQAQVHFQGKNVCPWPLSAKRLSQERQEKGRPRRRESLLPKSPMATSGSPELPPAQCPILQTPLSAAALPPTQKSALGKGRLSNSH